MLHEGVDDNLYANSAPGGNLVKNKFKIVLYFFFLYSNFLAQSAKCSTFFISTTMLFLILSCT